MKHIKTYEETVDKSQIEVLNLSNKNLKELPDLSEYINLKTLYCHNNQLTELLELPYSLLKIYCHNNQLTELPELPDSLELLYCQYNQLTSLPELPDSLELLSCSNNQLTSLPELPDSLLRLYCYNNKLPYSNLNEYKEWYAKTYPERIDAKKYNL